MCKYIKSFFVGHWQILHNFVTNLRPHNKKIKRSTNHSPYIKSSHITNFVLFLTDLWLYLQHGYIIARQIVYQFYDRYSLSAIASNNWYEKTKQQGWQNFHAIKNTFNSVDSIRQDRYVFNIGGNHYRLIALIYFKVRSFTSVKYWHTKVIGCYHKKGTLHTL